MSYITNTDISIRININPFCWSWLPFFKYEGPSMIFPKRKTIGFGWLFVQIYIDIDNGSIDLQNFKTVEYDDIVVVDE